MGLYFHNKAGSPVWVVYAYHAPDCEGSDKWSKKGWYKVSPGNTAKVWSGWAGGEKFFYFAEDASGHSWSGEFFTQVPSTAFEWCWDTGSTQARTVGFRKIFGSNMDYTINLAL